MLLVPTNGDSKVITNAGTVGSATPGTSVPDNATPNLYGTITELISAASNVQDSWGITVLAVASGSPSTIAGESSIDILIGGATDDVLISSILTGGTFHGGGRAYFFPVHVPAGVRIACQLSTGTAQANFGVTVWLHGGDAPGGMQSGRKVTTYGTKINNSRGVALSVAASGGAATATEIVASTTEDHFYFLPGFQVAVDTSIQAGTVNIGIGVGAATEERIGTWWFTKSAAEIQSGPFPSMGVLRDIPAGTRLTLLGSTDTTADSNYDGHVYAVS